MATGMPPRNHDARAGSAHHAVDPDGDGGQVASPDVSIVTIFHDPGPFFVEAIESVLAQTHPDWELLLVDDGSTDGSEATARRYAREFEGKIRYLHHPDRAKRGTGPSRNLGIANARGRYLTELDADDAWLPDFLADRLRVMEQRPDVDMVFAPVLRWYSWMGGADNRGKDWVARPWPVYDAVIDAPDLLPVLLQQASKGGVPKGVLVRTDLVRSVGAYPPEFDGMYEDQALLCKLGLVARSYLLPEWDYRYRRHTLSMVTVVNSTQDRNHLRQQFLEWLADHLEDQGFRDQRVQGPLKRELWRVRNPRLERARAWAETWQRRIQSRASRILRGAGLVGNESTQSSN